MAAAFPSNTMVMSNASTGPVATILATSDERMRRIGKFLDLPCLRRPPQSRGLTIANWSGVVVYAGEPAREKSASLLTNSVPTFQGDPTPAMKVFPFTSSSKMSDSLQIPVELRMEPEKDELGIRKVQPDVITCIQVTWPCLVITACSGQVDSLDLLHELIPVQDKANEAEEITKLIEEIRAMFRSLNDGDITTSPYDTAWVAMVPALDGSQSPQFPKSLEWIINNQLQDGSWGDCDYFLRYDRIINTLASVVALKTWKTGSVAIKRGLEFIQKNLQALETEQQAHMLIGFEIVFPALICFAQKLELNLPYDAPVILTICAARQQKLENIPLDIVHEVPTTLLHSLEGLHEEVDWKKLLKFQNEDGSFLSSPAATAACLLHTTDEKALGYLNRVLEHFNNAVPNVYPVELFEHMWMVDRLERLGIDRYFEMEIKDCLDHIHKCFTSFGIGWTSGSVVQDLDDTAMGFRLLRQHGYDVNENVFRQFRGKQNEFFCWAGYSGNTVSAAFNCYRAAQTRFPGETLLETAEKFSRGFLADKLEKNECIDKWVIPKDLRGEVEYALKTPWYCSVPLIETEAYLHHYGSDDIWIGKCLYRMPLISNETFLALAKADFIVCQATFQLELENIMRWRKDCGFEKLSFVNDGPLEVFLAGACIFRFPELTQARLTFAQMTVMVTVIDDYFDVAGSLTDLRKFVAAAREWDPSMMDGTTEEAQIVFRGLFSTTNEMIQEGTAQGKNIGKYLHMHWNSYLESVLKEAEWTAAAFSPSFDEYLKAAVPSYGLGPILLGSLSFSREDISDEFVNDSNMIQIMDLAGRIGRLLNDIHGCERENSEGKVNAVTILLRENTDWTEEEAISHVRALVEESMLKLVREVYQQSHIPKSVRHVYFNMARISQLFYQKTDAYRDHSFTAKSTVKKLFNPCCEN